MKVYALMGYEPYEDTYLLGIFSTKERAEKAQIKWRKSDPDMEYEVNEWEIDEE